MAERGVLRGSISLIGAGLGVPTGTPPPDRDPSGASALSERAFGPKASRKGRAEAPPSRGRAPPPRPGPLLTAPSAVLPRRGLRRRGRERRGRGRGAFPAMAQRKPSSSRARATMTGPVLFPRASRRRYRRGRRSGAFPAMAVTAAGWPRCRRWSSPATRGGSDSARPLRRAGAARAAGPSWSAAPAAAAHRWPLRAAPPRGSSAAPAATPAPPGAQFRDPRHRRDQPHPAAGWPRGQHRRVRPRRRC
jgi:hypothetical protein